MMIILRILAALGVLALVLVVVAFFLPRVVGTERSTVINAPAEKIFPLINSMKETGKWQPWFELDPDMAQTFEGPDAGVGSKVTWASDNKNVGSGSQTIVESVENEKVVTALDFGAQGTATAQFTLEPAEAGAKVTWGFETDTGYNPIARYFGLLIPSWVGADYEKGLANMKAVVEGG